MTGSLRRGLVGGLLPGLVGVDVGKPLADELTSYGGPGGIKGVGHGERDLLGTEVGAVVDPLEGRLPGDAVGILMTGSLRRGLAGVDVGSLLCDEVAS
jgi:hypothetical protein